MYLPNYTWILDTDDFQDLEPPRRTFVVPPFSGSRHFVGRYQAIVEQMNKIGSAPFSFRLLHEQVGTGHPVWEVDFVTLSVLSGQSGRWQRVPSRIDSDVTHTSPKRTQPLKNGTWRLGGKN